MRKLITIFFVFSVSVISPSISSSSASGSSEVWRGIKIYGCPETINISPGLLKDDMKIDEKLRKILSLNKARKTIIGRAITIDGKYENFDYFYSFISTLGSLKDIQGRVDTGVLNMLQIALSTNWTELNDKAFQEKYYDKTLNQNFQKFPGDYGKLDIKFYVRNKNSLVMFQTLKNAQALGLSIDGWKIIHLVKLNQCLVHVDTFLSSALFSEEDAYAFFRKTTFSVGAKHSEARVK